MFAQGSEATVTGARSERGRGGRKVTEGMRRSLRTGEDSGLSLKCCRRPSAGWKLGSSM